MDTNKLVEQITKAISYKYLEDGMRPGLLISVLRNGDYYASVLRFSSDYDNGRKVFFKAQASSLEKTLLALAKKIVSDDKPTKDPIDELKETLADSDSDESSVDG